MTERIRIFLELTKFKITAFSALSTVVGYILAADRVGWRILYAGGGILLLAMAAALLNEIQERHVDARMARTSVRPLPAGKISLVAAFGLFLVLAFSGGGLLLFGTNAPAFWLGMLALVWYNLVYTPLKRLTPFAAVPGALIGALPPAAGWAAAGGSLQDPRILMFAFFFFIWQVPHFWLLLLIYGKEYERAGFPSLTRVFRKEQLQRITFVWMSAAAVTSLSLPYFGAVQHWGIAAGLAGAAAWLIFRAAPLIGGHRRRIAFGLAFRNINFYVLIVLALISADKLMRIM